MSFIDNAGRAASIDDGLSIAYLAACTWLFVEETDVSGIVKVARIGCARLTLGGPLT